MKPLTKRDALSIDGTSDLEKTFVMVKDVFSALDLYVNSLTLRQEGDVDTIPTMIVAALHNAFPIAKDPRDK